MDIHFSEEIKDGFLYKYADIELYGGVNRIYFRFPLSVSDELTNRADPFVYALVFLMMKHGGEIRVHGLLSRSVMDNLTMFCRLWNVWDADNCKAITIEADLIDDDYRPSNRKMITAFSGGLDASYTLYKYRKNLDSKFQFDCNQSVMLWGADIPLSAADEFEVAYSSAKKMTDDLGVRLVPVKTNIREFLPDWEYAFGSVVAGTLNFFSKKYFYGAASDDSIQHFQVPWGMNPISDQYLASDTFRFISDGHEHSRTDRAHIIKDWKTGVSNLRVCWSNEDKSKNCGYCEKCVRTKLNFLANGVSHMPSMPRDFVIEDLEKVKIRNSHNLLYFDEIYEYAMRNNTLSSKILNALASFLKDANNMDQRIVKKTTKHNKVIQTNRKIIRLDNIIKRKSSLIYEYSVSESLLHAFNVKEIFSIEYDFDEYSDFSLIDVPNSILSIPFLGNVLPIAWLLDAELQVPEIDKKFYESLEGIKNGFHEMHPKLEFKGNLVPGKVIESVPLENDRNGPPIVFFSAGVDSWHTLMRHVEEKPILFAMIGADFFLGNKAGAEKFKQDIIEHSKKFAAGYIIFKTRLRKFINEEYLNVLFLEKMGSHWWNQIQHGLGVITHAAPISFLSGSRKIYFASTHSIKDRIPMTCASDPRVDNRIAYSNVQVSHDGYDVTRQEKLNELVEFFDKEAYFPFIHVCWKQDEENKNCCTCEKCIRSMGGIVAAKGDPLKFGFQYDGDSFYKRLQEVIEPGVGKGVYDQWVDILDGLRRLGDSRLDWLKDYDLKMRASVVGFSKQKYLKYKILSKVTFGKLREEMKAKYKVQKFLYRTRKKYLPRDQV